MVSTNAPPGHEIAANKYVHIAVKLNLPAYIQTQGFSRREWYPQIKLLKGKKMSKKERQALMNKNPPAEGTPVAPRLEEKVYMHQLAPKSIGMYTLVTNVVVYS